MPEQPSEPIPRDLADAFHAAIAAYECWGSGEDEPQVSIDLRPIAIGIVCLKVARYNDEPMPDTVWRRLLNLKIDMGDLDKDNSYGNGARGLERLINTRNADFQAKEKRLRES
jgi:hypothetical protein